MTATRRDSRSAWRRLREWAAGGPPTRASLFHYCNSESGHGALSELDWGFLRHPVRSVLEEWKAPRTRASLFHYLEQPGEHTAADWEGLIKDLFTGYRFAMFIPSIWANQEALVEERAALRTRRMEAGAASLVIHSVIASLAIFLAVYKPIENLPAASPVVFISTPMNLPFEGDGREGGGGGGGGKHEKLPPSGGRMPDTARVQLMPPEPGMPKPLVPSDNPLDVKASIQMPVDFPVDISVPIGVPDFPLSDQPSSGPGSGGGAGTGKGTGFGPGTGPGYGPGAEGGTGGGDKGGVGRDSGPGTGGSNLRLPVPISEPLPPYTEQARKARTEGLVTLEVIIRSNGTVEISKVVRGLGYGLDESAVSTVASKWRFRPATVQGVPIDFHATIEVTFRLY